MIKPGYKYYILILFSLFTLLPAHGITAKFSYTQLNKCSPSVLRFTNESSQGAAITYYWNFGLGALVTTKDVAVKEQLYSEPGQYKVTLKVTDGVNWDSTSTVITVYGGPAASFKSDKITGCPPLTVTLTSTSSAGESEIVKTYWDFRDGTYSDGQSVKHSYNSTGTYDIILRVTDKNGCYSTFESDKYLSLTEKPKADLVASDTFACTAPVRISFTNLSKGSSEMSYKWDFGNGKTSTDFSSPTVYTLPGSYDVKLKATDMVGCSDSLTKKSYINIGYARGTLAIYDGKNKLVNTSYLCDGTYRLVCSVANLPDYIWRITDNGSTTSYRGRSSFTYQVKGSGTIDIKVVYGKQGACTDSISASYVKSYIKASFTMSDKLFCKVPSEISLVNTSMNADKISWYFSDKLISTDKNTTYTITSADLAAETYEQIYSHSVNKIFLPVKLVASNGGACYDSVTSQVTIAKPVARFVPDKVSGCVPLQITFSDSSMAAFAIDQFTYDTGLGSITSPYKTDVKYTFTKPGVYNVKEIIRSNNCYDTSQVVRIYAGDKLKPDFTLTPAEVCNGGTIHLSGSADKNEKVTMWRFSSANLFDLNFAAKPDTDIVVYSDTLGNKKIKLQVDYNGCISDTIKQALNIKGLSGSFSERFSCDTPLVYHFKSEITPSASLVWKADTSTIISKDSIRYRFPSSGDYRVTLTASDAASGCSLIKSKTYKVRQLLSAFTASDTVLCVGDTLHLDSSGSIDYINTCYNEGFLWKFGDDSPPRRTFLKKYDHIYSSRGIDTVRLVAYADNGCTDTVKKIVKVFRPAGSFTTDKKAGCLPELTVNFTNTSTDSTIVYWIWNFGDNTADSTNNINVSHTFKSDNKQTFYPSLAVYDANQCTSNYSIPTSLTDANCEFQASDNAVCSGETVTFTPADSSLTNLHWDFGDETTSSTSRSHTYTIPGTYSVSLIGTKEGCTGKVTKTNFISVEKADANFSVSDTIFNCYPDTVRFIHNNSVGSPAVDYLWKFGKAVLTTRNSGDVKYVFTRPGNYTVSLTVKTVNGCTATSIRHITVNGPSAVITEAPQEICYNQAVTFRLDSMKNITSWKWRFGDGATSTLNPVLHNYTSRGKILPSVQLTNSTCNAILLLDTIYVSKVVANFKSSDSTLTVCLGNKLYLLNKSTGSASWEWYVNNVKASTGYNFNDILFGKTGDYNIKLVAKDTSSCADTIVKKFTVNPIPEFTISGDSTICSGKTSVDLSVDKSSGSVIRWSPATGLNSTTSFSVTASPLTTTTYTATVTNSYGCPSSEKKKILVNQPFDFTRTPAGDTTIYIGQKIQLIISAGDENVSYIWTPSDHISCTECDDPWVSPVETTTYNVEASDGCFDVNEKFMVEVIRDFYLEAPSAFTPNGDSNNDLFRFEQRNIGEFELKIFNRWGEMVFSTNDLNQGWDGYVNGHLQNIDTYKYTVKATTIHGYSFEKKGEFLLLK
jgi:gliding motility-associated-like protein